MKNIVHFRGGGKLCITEREARVLDEKIQEQDLDFKLVHRSKKITGQITVKDILFIERDIGVQLRDIELVVSRISGLEPFEINEKTRKREVVSVRQVCHYLSTKYTKNSLASIGEYFGGKDHATVLHSKYTVLNMIDTSQFEIVDLVNKAETMIKNEFLEHDNID